MTAKLNSSAHFLFRVAWWRPDLRCSATGHLSEMTLKTWVSFTFSHLLCHISPFILIHFIDMQGSEFKVTSPTAFFLGTINRRVYLKALKRALLPLELRTSIPRWILSQHLKLLSLLLLLFLSLLLLQLSIYFNLAKK